MLKHGILGLLNYGDMTGYEIMSAFRDSLQFFWTANTSQIYRELQTLKSKGFVNDRKVEQKSRPDKNVFSITESGKDELKSWLRDENYGNQNMGLLMKVFFSGELSPEENIERFRHFKYACTEYADGLLKADEAVEAYKSVVKSGPNKAAYWNMTVSFGKKYMQMLSLWCDECISELEVMSDEDTCD